MLHKFEHGSNQNASNQSNLAPKRRKQLSTQRYQNKLIGALRAPQPHISVSSTKVLSRSFTFTLTHHTEPIFHIFMQNFTVLYWTEYRQSISDVRNILFE